MMNWLRKNMRTIFIITIVGFIGGIFVGFGGYFFGGRGGVSDAVAEVNGVRIPYRKYILLFNRIMDNLRDSQKEITEQVIQQTKQDVIQDLVQEEVFYQEAKKYGIVVTDGEVAADIQRFPAFQQDGKFSHRVYFQILAWRLRMTPQEFEGSRRRQIAIAKLRNLVTSSIKISEPELRLEYARRHNSQFTNFEKDREKFYEELQQEKTLAFMNDWYRSINASLKVRVFTERF
ncbi:MAG: SurA N-terminal domain-containing protein [Elusimicrobiota bacterium]|nr:SurA N-terminal domain-containing protein [Elusimicrobiota bacterium]